MESRLRPAVYEEDVESGWHHHEYHKTWIPPGPTVIHPHCTSSRMRRSSGQCSLLKGTSKQWAVGRRQSRPSQPPNFGVTAVNDRGGGSGEGFLVGDEKVSEPNPSEDADKFAVHRAWPRILGIHCHDLSMTRANGPVNIPSACHCKSRCLSLYSPTHTEMLALKKAQGYYEFQLLRYA